MALTIAGERLANALHVGFTGMIEAVEEITGQQEIRPLHISTTPTFAASWLMPRLPSFREAHPEIDLMIDPSPLVVSLGASGIDVAIRYGAGGWPGVESEMLLQSPMVVVAAPTLVGEKPFEDLKALSEYPWLEEFCTSEATNWFKRFGLPRAKLGMMQVPGNLMLDGARDGQGVVVTVREFVARDVAAGRLRELHVEDQSADGYHIVTRPGVQRKWVKAFTSWLRREAVAAAQVSPVRS
jgi:LysR family glycine cleavage system transcriptional activator